MLGKIGAKWGLCGLNADRTRNERGKNAELAVFLFCVSISDRMKTLKSQIRMVEKVLGHSIDDDQLDRRNALERGRELEARPETVFNSVSLPMEFDVSRIRKPPKASKR